MENSQGIQKRKNTKEAKPGEEEGKRVMVWLEPPYASRLRLG
jgi:hypothetical protein